MTAPLGRLWPLWLGGLLRRRAGSCLLAALSLAAVVGYVAGLVGFAGSTTAGLTRKAAASVGVDWQVQVAPGGDPAAAAAAARRLPGVRAVLEVRRARVTGLRASTVSGTRTTGSAVLVTIPAGYAEAAPGEVRSLLGAPSGVLAVQQTAANLAVGVGDAVGVVGAPAGTGALTVAGVVDLPMADSFFQAVGAPPGASATAPPDNVLLVPAATFDRLTTGSSSVVTQEHVLFDHALLPRDPAAAADEVSRRANRYQADLVGGVLVGDNLATSLYGARQDALYAQLLLLLLGVPALGVAVTVTVLVLGLRGAQRQRERSLLRLRGAGARRVAGLAVAEAALLLAGGVLLGVPVALGCARLTGEAAHVSPGQLATGATIAAATVLLALLLPVRREATGGGNALAPGLAPRPRTRTPLPLRLGLDVVLLGVAAVVFALTASGGYALVVAPEGVTVSSVNYAALLAPAAAWPGLALLVWRLTGLAGRLPSWRERWRRHPGRGRPGHLAAPEITAAALTRRRHPLGAGAAALAVAVGVTLATAAFTTTYDGQARLDVALTVGADASVTAPPGQSVPAPSDPRVTRAAAVRAVEPLLHRFAYVGPDLQDVYGVRTASIAAVTPLQDGFVPGSTVHAALTALAARADAVLLSAETLKDYQLAVGDTVRLRLQAGPAKTYTPVSFHVAGQVKEFPTAPKDSFIVANADYLARVTGDATASTLLVASGNPAATAAGLRAALPPSLRVQDVVSGRQTVTTASGLAASDLSGLARLNAVAGVGLALVVAVLVLLRGALSRRRGLTVLTALGATARQRGGFLRRESHLLLLGGLLGGVGAALLMTSLLVKVLTGVFDPPPDHLAVPLLFCALVLLGIGVAVEAVRVLSVRRLGGGGALALREE